MERHNGLRKIQYYLYADPPWAYLWGTGKDGGNFAPEKHYQTMSVDEICALNVKAIRDKINVLYYYYKENDERLPVADIIVKRGRGRPRKQEAQS